MREEADEGVMSIFYSSTTRILLSIFRPILKNWRRASGDFSKTEKQPKKFSLGRLEVLDGRLTAADSLLFGPEAYYFPTEIWFHVI